MKRKAVFFVAVLCFACFAVSSLAQGIDAQKLGESIARSMSERGADVKVQVEVLKKLEAPAGYYFLKLTFLDKKKNDAVAGQQYLFSDGEFIVQDFLNSKDMSSLAKDLTFEYSAKNIDVSGLTLVMGNPKAKNIIVEATDFQCPFCVKANAYLHEKLKGRKDVAVYIMHFPLRNMHPKAEILAKSFEAGMMMGKNFAQDLYDPANGELTDAQIIDKYAKKSGDPAKFRKLVSSSEVSEKVKKSEAQAAKLDVRSTPTIFVNGKTISGFDQTLLDKAVDSFHK